MFTVVVRFEICEYTRRKLFNLFTKVRSKHFRRGYVKLFLKLTLYHTIPTLNIPEEEGFGKHSGKGENAGKQDFLLFPECFLLYQRAKLSV